MMLKKTIQVAVGVVVVAAAAAPIKNDAVEIEEFDSGDGWNLIENDGNKFENDVLDDDDDFAAAVGSDVVVWNSNHNIEADSPPKILKEMVWI